MMKKSIIVFCAIIACSFSLKKTNKFSKLDSFVFIPSGTTHLDNKSYSCNAFWMASTEVTNANYRDFLADLKASGDMDSYRRALPDTSNWNDTTMGFTMKSMKEVYFWHPAYDAYPVVNVTKEDANLYCIWLTEKMRKMFPDDHLNEFRLPTREEWVYAARGGLKNSPYPWGGPSPKNTKGCSLANYFEIGEQNIKRNADGSLAIVDSKSFIYSGTNEYFTLANVKTYRPNGYGLFNMSGNCAELVAGTDHVVGGSWKSTGFDIRIESSEEYLGARPTIGFRPVTSFLNKPSQ